MHYVTKAKEERARQICYDQVCMRSFELVPLSDPHLRTQGFKNVLSGKLILGSSGTDIPCERCYHHELP